MTQNRCIKFKTDSFKTEECRIRFSIKEKFLQLPAGTSTIPWDPLKYDFARSDRARINPAFLCFETLNFELYATILSHFGVM